MLLSMAWSEKEPSQRGGSFFHYKIVNYVEAIAKILPAGKRWSWSTFKQIQHCRIASHIEDNDTPRFIEVRSIYPGDHRSYDRSTFSISSGFSYSKT
jgi:hypothetical protein